jgi:hypothetical protein
MGGVRSTFGREEDCINFFVRKPEGKRLIAISRRRWKDNTRMYLREIG